MNDIYQQLRERLDALSTGFPGTPDSIEIRVLKKLFSEEDAGLFLKMSPMLETPEAVAERLSMDRDAIAARLEDMAVRGLLFRLRKKGAAKYSAIPYVIGIMENQVGRLDGNMARVMDDYFEAGFGKTLASTKTPLMRTVPVNRDIARQWPIGTYDDVMDTIDAQQSIMVGECICRKAGRLNGKSCGKPLESCFLFGHLADYYVDNGWGRHVTPAEAKEIVRRNLDEAPLVIQLANAQKGSGFCMCCGDCCGILRSLKMQPKPAEAARSNYRAVVDSGECTSCGECLDRCQMEAITETEGGVSINYDRCIGCGLCVTGCPSAAMKLEKKSPESAYTPPDNFMLTYIEIAKERGKI